MKKLLKFKKFNFRLFIERKLMLSAIVLLFGVKAQAQVDQVSAVQVKYSPGTVSGYDTLVKVFVKVDLSDSVPVKKLIVKAGTTSGASNIYNQTLNYKGTATSAVQQANSTVPLQKVGMAAYVYVGQFLYQDLFYQVQAQRMDGSFTPAHNITEIH